MDVSDLKDAVKEIAGDIKTTFALYAPDAWAAMVKVKRAEGVTAMATNAVQTALVLIATLALGALALWLWLHSIALANTPAQCYQMQGGNWCDHPVEAGSWFTAAICVGILTLGGFIVTFCVAMAGILDADTWLDTKAPEAAVTRDIVDRVLQQ